MAPATVSPTAAKINLRAAETPDIPRIASVIIAAMEHSPHWTWRHAYRKAHPGVHQRETEKRIAEYVRQSKDGICVALVAETDVEREVDAKAVPEVIATTEDLLLGNSRARAAAGNGRRKGVQTVVAREIVGVAIAQLPGTFVEPMTRILKKTPSPSAAAESEAVTGTVKGKEKVDAKKAAPPSPLRADVHPERNRVFMAEFGPAKRRYFDSVYGNSQLYIDFMAVDPDFHRRGIAGQLMEWMLELARNDKEIQAVTLFSSPLGMHLYKKAGFEEVGSVSVKLEGDTEEGGPEGVVAPVMIWKRQRHMSVEKE